MLLDMMQNKAHSITSEILFSKMFTVNIDQALSSLEIEDREIEKVKTSKESYILSKFSIIYEKTDLVFLRISEIKYTSKLKARTVC